MTGCGEYAKVARKITVKGIITMAGNLLIWLISSALLLAYFWFVTLRKPFKTVGKHFLILLGVHLALSITAIQLKKSGHFLPAEYRTAGLWFIKGYMAVIVVLMVNFFAALAERGVAKMAGFHERYNAPNLHRQPLRAFLRHQSAVVWGYRVLLLAGGIYMLWAMCFRMGL